MSDRDATKDKTTQAQLGQTSGGKGTGNASSGLQPGQAHAPSAATVTGGGAPSEPASRD